VNTSKETQERVFLLQSTLLPSDPILFVLIHSCLSFFFYFFLFGLLILLLVISFIQRSDPPSTMADTQSSQPETRDASARRRCAEFPWHQVLRIANGLCIIGVGISAFFCFTACNGGTPNFRDYLLSVYVIFFCLIALAGEVRIGCQWLFRKLPWTARFIWRGLFCFFIASLSLGSEIWQIFTAALLMLTGLLNPLYYVLARNKARGIERMLLPWLYLEDALNSAAAAMEAGKAQAAAGVARAQAAASTAQQQGQVYAQQAQQQGQAYAQQAQQQGQAYAQQAQQRAADARQQYPAGYGSQATAQGGAPPPPPPAI
jgi:hypothetical protein